MLTPKLGCNGITCIFDEHCQRRSPDPADPKVEPHVVADLLPLCERVLMYPVCTHVYFELLHLQVCKQVGVGHQSQRAQIMHLSLMAEGSVMSNTCKPQRKDFNQG